MRALPATCGFGLLCLTMSQVRASELPSPLPPYLQSPGPSQAASQHVERFDALRKTGQEHAAAAELRKLLPLLRQMHGPKTGELIAPLQWLIRYHTRRGEFPAALELACEALAVERVRFGPAHWRLVNARQDVAFLRRALALDEVGRQRLSEALRLDERVEELAQTGDVRQALELQRRARTVRQGLLDSQDLQRAGDLMTEATLAFALEDLNRAEECLHAAQPIFYRRHGEDHPSFADCLHFQGELCRRRGQFGLAEVALTEALHVRRRLLGEDHPDYAAALTSLGLVNCNQGKLDRAEALWREALRRDAANLGQDHPRCARGLGQIGVLYHKRGDQVRAEVYLTMAVERYRASQAENGADHLWCLGYLCATRMARGDYAGAEPVVAAVLAGVKGQAGFARGLDQLTRLYEKSSARAEVLPILHLLHNEAASVWFPTPEGSQP